MRELKFECQSSTEVLEKLDVFAMGIGALEDAQKVCSTSHLTCRL